MTNPDAKDPASNNANQALHAQGEAFFIGAIVFVNLLFGLMAYGSANDPSSGVSVGASYAMWASIIIPLNIYLLAVFFKLRRRTRDGQLAVKGSMYPYVIGNTLTWYADQTTMPDMLNVKDKADLTKVTSRFRGVKVTLPIQLPHVYFDNKRDWGILSPYLIDPRQKIDMEGDFPSEYQVYVPRGGEIEALSVFQPDVLQVILRNAHGYDIEFYNNELRVISHRTISGSPKRQQEVVDIAAAIINELENRFAIWGRKGFKSRPLAIYRLRGVMIGRYYLSIAQAAAFIFLAVPGILIGLAALDVLFEFTGSVSLGEKSSLLSGTMILSGVFFAGYWWATANLKHKESAIRSLWGKRLR